MGRSIFVLDVGQERGSGVARLDVVCSVEESRGFLFFILLASYDGNRIESPVHCDGLCRQLGLRRCALERS